MRLPSSSSLLLASLASSSSLSALAAPTGDCPDDSSSTASAPPNRDDSAIRSNSKSTSCTTATFASDTVTDDLQSRGLVNDLLAALPLPPPTNAIVEGLFDGLFSSDKKIPKARADLPLPIDEVKKTVGGLTGNGGAGRRAARQEESGETDSPQDPSSPAAANPDGSAKPPPPAAPAAPSPPTAPAPGLPLKPPVPLPVSELPVNPPAGRRDASDVNELLSPILPPGPPNTPAQRDLPIKLPKLPLAGL